MLTLDSAEMLGYISPVVIKKRDLPDLVATAKTVRIWAKNHKDSYDDFVCESLGWRINYLIQEWSESFDFGRQIESYIANNGQSYNKKQIHYFFDALQMLPLYAGDVWRGWGSDPHYKIGEIHSWSRFSATSIDPCVAKGFGSACVFHIVNCEGYYIEPFSSFGRWRGNYEVSETENEVILPPIEFKVLSIERRLFAQESYGEIYYSKKKVYTIEVTNSKFPALLRYMGESSHVAH